MIFSCFVTLQKYTQVFKIFHNRLYSILRGRFCSAIFGRVYVPLSTISPPSGIAVIITQEADIVGLNKINLLEGRDHYHSYFSHESYRFHHG